MDNLFRFAKDTREYFTPVLENSAFVEKGILTPEEFVIAGDQLVAKFPTWQWSAGEPSKRRPHLPADKQFLWTRGIPSYSRATSLSRATMVDQTIEGGLGEAEGDWCAPELLPPEELSDEVLIDALEFEAKENVDAIAVTGKKGGGGGGGEEATAAVSKPPPTKSDEDDYADMEDESLALDEASSSSAVNRGGGGGVGRVDEVTAVFAASTLSNGGGGTEFAATSTGSSSSSLLRTRRYDVSMTYDKYYRTPRIWLFGYDENGSPLSPTAVFEDVMTDYAKKTVTIDPHPHLSKPHGEGGRECGQGVEGGREEAVCER